MSEKITKFLGIFSGRKGMYVAIIIFVLIVSIIQPIFLSITNITTMSKQMVILSVLCIAVTFPIIGGEFDLSIASVAVLSSMVVAVLLKSGYDPLLVVGAGLSVGAIVGIFNGIVTVKGKVPSFLITLGTMTVCRGIAYHVTPGQPGISVPVFNVSFLEFWARGSVGPVSNLFIWLLVIIVIGYIILHRTVYGKHLFASGSSPIGARYSGVNIYRIKTSALLISGIIASFAGILLLGRTGVGRFDTLTGFELDAIAGTIIGGTAMTGGRGAISAPIIGALLLTLLTNALIMLGFGLGMEWVGRGVLIIAAILVGRRKL